MPKTADLQVLYHGYCFDGVVSAAVFTRFFLDLVRPGATVSYRAMSHGRGDPYGEDHDATFCAPVNAVVDFRYSPSPRLTWWCDHHRTTFLDPSHRRHLDADRSGRRCFDPDALSCAGLLQRWLGQLHGLSDPVLEDHVVWADLIDSASFSSPAQAVELAEPALQLMALLEAVPPVPLVETMITELTRCSIAQVHELPVVQRHLAPVLAEHRRLIELLRSRLQVEGAVGTFDLSDDGVQGHNKFIPYYLQPDLRYTVGVTCSWRRAKVSVGSNPWQRPEPLVDLGELCHRHGGGGHPAVGAVSLPPGELQTARRIAEEIAALLRRV